ncbi:MAG: AAA family ATPase [Succinimonas sp.]|nr:AAA family ATPase [Succinimonas sp.]
MEYLDLAGNKIFKDLVTSSAAYVDKTANIAELYQARSKFEMLTRPFGFGKTVFLDTLYYMFSKRHPEFFENLAVSSMNITIPKQSVVKLDFSVARTEKPEDLADFLFNYYRQTVFEYGLDGYINSEDTTFWQTMNFIKILARSSPTGKAVLLIDNYDSPIIREFFSKNKIAAIWKVLLDFYRALWMSQDLIDWCVLTGEIKFFLNHPKYEGLPYITDLTFNERANAVCGFTPGDMKKYYNDFIQDEAEIAGVTEEQFLSNLGDWYGGFRYTGHKISMMRPSSIKSFLSLSNQNVYREYYPYKHVENFLPRLLKKYGLNHEKLLSPASCGYTFAEWNFIDKVNVFAILTQMGIFSFSHINISLDDMSRKFTYFSKITNVEMRDIYKQAKLAAEKLEDNQ